MKTFLFQGDSITDWFRSRTDDRALGCGYANLTAAKIEFNYPGEFNFVNRGVGGDRSTNLYARCLFEMDACKPDYMSVLIGVNDVWHALSNNISVQPERYEQIMCMLIEDAKAAFPEVKIFILEPFVLKACSTEKAWEAFDTNVRALAQIARKLAEKYSLTFIPLQDKFDALAAETAPENWLFDGVHPTAGGHELISQELFKATGL